MEQGLEKEHLFYRITDIEYANNGYCYVGVKMPEIDESNQFRLSNFCHRLSWLRHFKRCDLESIWALAKNQRTVSLTKKLWSYAMIKLCTLELMLSSFEDEARVHYSGHGSDFEDW